MGYISVKYCKVANIRRDVNNLHVGLSLSTCLYRKTNDNTWTNRRNRSLNNLLKMSRQVNEPSGPAILQVNVEGLTRSKCDVIQLIATKHSASVILLQETHTTSNDNIRIYGFFLISPIFHEKYGIAILVRNDLTANLVQSSKDESQMQWLTIMMNDDITITNFYKPPKTPFVSPPLCQHPTIYSRDFICHHTS